jgi:hypothetical protein
MKQHINRAENAALQVFSSGQKHKIVVRDPGYRAANNALLVRQVGGRPSAAGVGAAAVSAAVVAAAAASLVAWRRSLDTLEDAKVDLEAATTDAAEAAEAAEAADVSEKTEEPDEPEEAKAAEVAEVAKAAEAAAAAKAAEVAEVARVKKAASVAKMEKQSREAKRMIEKFLFGRKPDFLDQLSVEYTKQARLQWGAAKKKSFGNSMNLLRIKYDPPKESIELLMKQEEEEDAKKMEVERAKDAEFRTKQWKSALELKQIEAENARRAKRYTSAKARRKKPMSAYCRKIFAGTLFVLKKGQPRYSDKFFSICNQLGDPKIIALEESVFSSKQDAMDILPALNLNVNRTFLLLDASDDSDMAAFDENGSIRTTLEYLNDAILDTSGGRTGLVCIVINTNESVEDYNADHVPAWWTRGTDQPSPVVFTLPPEQEAGDDVDELAALFGSAKL